MVRMILAVVAGAALVGVALAEESNLTAKEDALIVRKVHTEVVTLPERNPRRWEVQGKVQAGLTAAGWSLIDPEVYGPMWDGGCK